MTSLPKRVCGHLTPVFEMDAHLIAAFDELVSDLSQRRGGTESMALRKKAPACDRGLVSVQASHRSRGCGGVPFTGEQ